MLKGEDYCRKPEIWAETFGGAVRSSNVHPGLQGNEWGTMLVFDHAGTVENPAAG